jgi:hypothetical protein
VAPVTSPGPIDTGFEPFSHKSVYVAVAKVARSLRLTGTGTIRARFNPKALCLKMAHLS